MIKVLLAVQDKDSKDFLKAVCSSMGCRVLVADNSKDLLHILHQEKINIVFSDLTNLFLASLDFISMINDRSQERPIILISEQVGHVEEVDFSTKEIFYNISKPFNHVEIEHVISAAISAVNTKLPEKTFYAVENIVSEISIKKEQIGKRKQKSIPSAFRYVVRGIPDIDRKITFTMQRVNLKYFEHPFSFLAKPVKIIDGLMIKFAGKRMRIIEKQNMI